MIRIGICGYGNLGKGVEEAIKYSEDMELVAIFSRRDIQTAVPLIKMEDMEQYRKKIDVVIMCGGSAKDLPNQVPQFAKIYNTVDSFDTHKNIPEYIEKINRINRKSNTISLISAGWDPGLFSINRLYSEAIIPNAHTYTFWGKGVSQGHSDAIRKINGVKNAIQYTIPIDSEIEKARRGEILCLTNEQKHLRECFVVPEEGADLEDIKQKIINMKKISDFSKKFYQIDEASLQSSHNKLKLVANRSAFLKILNSVIDGIPAKSADPNYMNFLITINDEEKTILASDGAITIIHSLANDENPVLKSYEPGTIEIPARHFVSIISKLEGEEVILTQIENSFLNITDNYSNFNIKCSRGEEFPQLDIHFTSSHTFEIDGNDFLNLYNSTAFAVATRGPKKHFYGVKIGVNNNILEFVATDSYRLAQRKVAVENNEKFYFIAPVKALSLVAKYCEGKKVLISEDNNLASFKFSL